jgi:hypothetical protein
LSRGPFGRHPGPPRDRLDFDGSDADATRIRSEIDRLGRECGCRLGSAFAIAGVCLYGSLRIVDLLPGRWDADLVTSIGEGLVVMLISATLGRFIGMGRARNRRIALLRELGDPAHALPSFPSKR